MRHFMSKTERMRATCKGLRVSESVVPMRHATTAKGVAGDLVLPWCCYVCGRGTASHYAMLQTSHFKPSL